VARSPSTPSPLPPPSRPLRGPYRGIRGGGWDPPKPRTPRRWAGGRWPSRPSPAGGQGLRVLPGPKPFYPRERGLLRPGRSLTPGIRGPGSAPGSGLLPVWWAIPPVYGLGTAVAVPVWPGHAPADGPRVPRPPRSPVPPPPGGFPAWGKRLCPGAPTPQTFRPFRALPHPSGYLSPCFGGGSPPPSGAEAPAPSRRR